MALLVPGLAAHELSDNRATLVLRDDTHLSLTVYVSLADALHQALAPKTSLQQFLVVYSAMNPEGFQKELLRAQARFQSSTRLIVGAKREVPFTNWVWPEAKQVQDLLRYQTMQAIADPNAHTHETPVAIHADANAAEKITMVRVQFPDEFQKVLVVSYRPDQVWVESKAMSPVIKFK